ncbi:hypothetical protein NMYAN_60114 [Nitrosomonas nitrosa]|uniref:Uncharacterized protein n=1 Tax=Nitrosomonas nitrosa TaxID=52442 RepID=A0A8H8Z2W4_9PROT|nr:hypothetical protein NMYAN_60114 [Nitrosomonas nitrosa]
MVYLNEKTGYNTKVMSHYKRSILQAAIPGNVPNRIARHKDDRNEYNVLEYRKKSEWYWKNKRTESNSSIGDSTNTTNLCHSNTN